MEYYEKVFTKNIDDYNEVVDSLEKGEKVNNLRLIIFLKNSRNVFDITTYKQIEKLYSNKEFVVVGICRETSIFSKNKDTNVLIKEMYEYFLEKEYDLLRLRSELEKEIYGQ